MTDKKIIHLLNDHGIWTVEKFGFANDPLPSLHHLRNEVEEAIQAPFDELEYADIFLLGMSGFWRTNRDAEDLFQAIQKKIEINKARKWPENPDEKGIFHHIG